MTPSIFMALYKRVKYNTNNKKVVGTHITNEAVRIVIWKAAVIKNCLGYLLLMIYKKQPEHISQIKLLK